MDEDSDHILFRCIVARFTWSVICEATGCDWNPSGFTNLYHLISNTSGRDARMAWVGVGAMSWALWNAHNKALIEGIVFKHAAGRIYKIVILLQLWRALGKR